MGFLSFYINSLCYVPSEFFRLWKSAKIIFYQADKVNKLLFYIYCFS